MLHAVTSQLFTLNAENTATFLRDSLHFDIELKHDCWYANNGSIHVQLVESERDRCGTLQVQSSNFDTDITSLKKRSDIQAVNEQTTINSIKSQTFACDCGIKLYIFHELDEDERGELLPLPTTLEWDSLVILPTQRILRVTPIAFREKARIQTTQKAEYLAVSEGNLSVSMANAMQALAEITPEFQHRALFEAMLDEGIEASLYLDPKTWESSEDERA